MRPQKIILSILLLIFGLIFLACLGYWAYQIYYIHTTDFTNVSTDIAIATAAAHEVAAFQACILSLVIVFMIIFILLKS